MRWIHADEEHPDTDRRVIVIMSIPIYEKIEMGARKNIQYVAEGYYKNGWWIQGGYDMRKFITHWSDFPPEKKNDN